MLSCIFTSLILAMSINNLASIMFFMVEEYVHRRAVMVADMIFAIVYTLEMAYVISRVNSIVILLSSFEIYLDILMITVSVVVFIFIYIGAIERTLERSLKPSGNKYRQEPQTHGVNTVEQMYVLR